MASISESTVAPTETEGSTQENSHGDEQTGVLDPHDDGASSVRTDHSELSLGVAQLSKVSGDHVGASGSAVVRLRNVHKTYLLGTEGVPALRGVSLTVAPGEFIVVLGKSGGGKSTLLNVVGTIDRPTRGDMLLCGHRVNADTPDSVLARIRLQHCSYIFQAFNLIPTLTATENVMLPLTIGGFAGDKKLRAHNLLRAVGLSHRLDHKPAELSGGEQQRVTIARALCNSPELLLADEPTGDLDSSNSDIVMKLITDLNIDRGMTVVMVTHDRALKAFAHRVVHMVDGKIARIEVVSKDVRDEALASLAQAPAVRALEAEHGGSAAAMASAQQQSKSTMAAPGGAAAPLVSPSGPPTPEERLVRPHTTTRKPGHYPAFRHSAARRDVIRHPVVGVIRTSEQL